MVVTSTKLFGMARWVPPIHTIWDRRVELFGLLWRGTPG